MTELETKLSQILEEKQNKIIPENIKKGIQIFDITGTYEGNSGGVKLFETEEQMQQDPNANEGDLAVVYREEIQNMTADSQTQFITFPETVTLPQALTESYYCRLRATDPSKMFDGNIMLDQNSFRFDGFTDTGMIRVSYTSSDGITYTREEFMGDNGELTNPVDLGTEIHCEMQEEWNDTMGYFMQVGGNIFEGLFECNNIPNPDTVSAYKFYKYIEENGERIPDKEDTEFTKEEVTLFKECMENSNFDSVRAVLIKAVLIKDLDTEEYYVVYMDAAVLLTSEKAYICGIPPRNNEESVNFYNTLYKVNTNTKTLEKVNTTSSITAIQGDDCWFGCPLPNMNKIQISKVGYPDFEESDIRYYANNSQFVDIDLPLRTNVLKYEFAPSQLNATKDSVYNSVYYGQDGINEGALTQNVSNSFADINAEVYNKIQKAYDNMEPRVLTDNDKTIDKNIYFILTNTDGNVLLDTSQVTSMENMFNECKNLCEIPLIDTSSVTSFRYTFASCSNLTKIALLDTSKVTTMDSAFVGCKSLEEIPLFNTSSVTNMTNTFSGCTSLTELPQLNTDKVTDMNYMCSGCTNLVTVPVLNTSSIDTMGVAFENCPNLSDESLNNIMQMCISATNVSTKTLAYIGLTSDQATKCTTLSNWQACVSSGWTTGY